MTDITGKRGDGDIAAGARRHTNESLMSEIFKIIETMPDFERAKEILDYMSPESFNVETLTDYEFDLLAVPSFGGSEGIYVDCYLSGVYREGDTQPRKLSAGTLKTLGTSLEDMKIMGELCGIITHTARDYIARNIMLFTPGKEIEAMRIAAERAKEAAGSAAALAKQKIGPDAIVTGAQPGRSYTGKIIGIAGSGPDTIAIQRISDSQAVLHRIKEIPEGTNITAGDGLSITKGKDGRYAVSPRDNGLGGDAADISY
jgi:hypothetical protein